MYISSTLDFEFGHIACFGQWHVVGYSTVKICKALVSFSLLSCSVANVIRIFLDDPVALWRKVRDIGTKQTALSRTSTDQTTVGQLTDP